MVVLGLLIVLGAAAIIGVQFLVIVTTCNEMREGIERARRFYTGRTTAKVVEVEIERYGYSRIRNDFYYWPVFHYEVDGVEYEKKTCLFTDQDWWYQKGWEYEIRYNTSNPEEFMLVDDEGSYDRAIRIPMEEVFYVVVAGGLVVLIVLLKWQGIRL